MEFVEWTLQAKANNYDIAYIVNVCPEKHYEATISQCAKLRNFAPILRRLGALPPLWQSAPLFLRRKYQALIELRKAK